MQIAVFLLYFNAFFALLFEPVASLYGVAIIVGGVAAGFGIANERKWGYALGIGVAALPLALVLLGDGVSLLRLMFDIALVALLLHPQSRDYQRIWFK